MALHISISAEPVLDIAGFSISNSLLTGSIVSLLILAFAFSFQSKPKQNIKPKSRLYTFVEMIIEALYNLTIEIAGPKKARVFFPLIATAFLFILLNNWAGLIPGVGTIGIVKEAEVETAPHAQAPNQAYATANTQSEAISTTVAATPSKETVSETVNSEVEAAATPETSAAKTESHGPKFVPIFRAATADLNTTLALALITMTLVQYYGIKFLGVSYFTKFLNFKNPIFTFVGFLEIISEFSKIISFAFRLFGNIFAGEVLLSVIAFIIPVIAPLPFLGLEVFVGMIQALVFAMLSLVFINMATIGHDEH